VRELSNTSFTQLGEIWQINPEVGLSRKPQSTAMCWGMELL